MITEFTRQTDFVPERLDATVWENLALLYAALIDREIDSPEGLERLLIDRSELDAAASEASSTLYINMTCHTDDEAHAGAYLAFVENVQPELKEASFELDKKVAGSAFADRLDPARYRVLLRDTRAAVGLFRPENIPLETELSRLDQEYSRLCGAMTVAFRGEERTLPQMARYNEETDRATREDAWRAVAERRFLDAERVEAIFEKMLALRHEVALNAGFDNYRDYVFKAKRRFDYRPADCDAFAAGVERTVVPAVRRLSAERGRALGVGALRPWDSQVDIKGRPPLRPFETASELVERTGRLFARMDPSLHEMFSSLCGGDCLDLETRKGKAPGGYQSNRDRVRRPFIFMNAAGLQRDVETIVHEAGHAFHSLLCRNDPLLPYRSEIPLEMAEVASMSMELTSHPFLGEFYPSPADADRARRVHLESMAGLLTWVAIVDQFQHWLYTNPGHSRAERHAEWVGLNRRYGAGLDWTGLERFLETSWHRILHLFGVPFYYIEYGIAQLGAVQLWLGYREDPARAIGAYKRALALGGSRTLPELYAAADLRFEFGPEMIARLWSAVETELTRLPM